MEETSANPEKTTVETSQTPGKQRKPLYLILTVGIALIVTLLGYFFLVASKPTKTIDPEETKVATDSSETKEKEEKVIGKVYVTALEGLNLREEASTSSFIKVLLPHGTELKIISKDGDWYFVEAHTRGFVNAEFVSDKKPEGSALVTFSNTDSPFKFLYPEVYKVSFTRENNILTYNFSGNESFGGFKVEIGENMATLGNYALKNYPQAQKGSCEPIRFGTQATECEKVVEESGTTFLLLTNTTLYKITYLKTEGGLFTDLNNLVFYSLYFD